MASTEVSVRDDFIECYSQQLDELELLQSMYPNSDEVNFTDSTVITHIQKFINYEINFTPPHLDFVLNVIANNMKLEICVNIPSLYPKVEPDVHVRCNQLNRYQESKLNTDLLNYIKEIPRGDTCLYTIVSWIQENVNTLENDKTIKKNGADPLKKEDNFARYWIYSHHIYNKKKRDKIINTANNLNLNGFCLPGKPGIICLEGEESKCKEWWKIIKSLCWKKITIKKSELFKFEEKEKQQIFSKFDELYFPNTGNCNSKHMDMASFCKYMEDCKLSDTFNDFFGLCKDDII